MSINNRWLVVFRGWRLGGWGQLDNIHVHDTFPYARQKNNVFKIA